MDTQFLTPQNVYALQRDARDAQSNASYLAEHLSREAFHAARAGAPVGTTDWMRDPRYVELQAKADTLAEAAACAQEALGGVVYRVPSYNAPVLTEKLTKLRKRAEKIGGLTVEWCADTREEIAHDDGTVSRFYFFVVNADPVRIAGWTFLAKLSIEEGGVLVSKIPGASRAWQLHHEKPESGWNIDDATTAAQAALDALNLGAYADEATACDCDHCGLDRRRKATYLVEEVATGAIKQVGSSCLRDFLGTDPANVLRYAEYLRDLDDYGNEDEGGGFGGSSAKREVSTIGYLWHVCAMIRVNGWAARSGSDRPTADEASANIWALSEQRRDKFGNKLWTEIEDGDRERAKAALAWGLEHFGAIDSYKLSDFDRNMLVAARGSVVSANTKGILAYLPVAHARFLEKEIELARERETAVESAHVGTVGQRGPFTLTCLKIFETEGHYGTTYITQFEDEAGNRFKWFGSYELDRGKTYSGTWTIKGHDEYKGVKETVVTRPAKITPVTAEQTQLAVN